MAGQLLPWIDSGDAEGNRNSMQNFLGDGVTTSFDFNFAGGYIDVSHVKAYLYNFESGITEAIDPVVLTGPNTIQVIPAPTLVDVGQTVGQALVVYRDTPKDQPLVDYSTGAVLDELNLDTSNQQAVFATAEMADRFDAINASSADAIERSFQALTIAQAADAKSDTAIADSAAAVITANAAEVTAANALQVAEDAVAAATGFNVDIDMYTGNDTTARDIQWSTGSVASPGNKRWELGTDAASDFALRRFNDAGTLQDSPITVDRQTGQVRVGDPAGLTGSADKVQVVGNVGAQGLNMDVAAGAGADLRWRTAGSARWIIGKDGVAEVGADAGSNILFDAVSDNGTTRSRIFTVNRASKVLAFANSPTMPTPAPGDNTTKGATTAFVKQYVDAQDLLYAQAHREIIMNPHGQINQAFGNTTVDGGYLADQWAAYFLAAGGAFNAGTSNDSLSLYSPANLFFTCTTAKASLAAGDYAQVSQPIEGVHIQQLMYGTANARGSWVRFRAVASAASTVVSVAIRNAAGTRTFVQPVTVGTTPADYSVFVPGVTDGVWNNGSTNLAASLLFTLASGTNNQTSSLGVWNSDSKAASNTQTNIMSNAGNYVRITDVSWRPSQVLMPFTADLIPVQLSRVQRYYERADGLAVYGNQAAQGDTFRNWWVPFAVEKRVTTYIGTVVVNSVFGAVGTKGLKGMAANYNPGNTTDAIALQVWVADARM